MAQIFAVVHIEFDQIASVERRSLVRAVFGLMPKREFAVVLAPDHRFMRGLIRPEHNT
ncbi:hypothetical protein CLG85_002420 [Yangia mangrovi]|uniref:Uncharacterized protein n=1 Tax=Alloyangia mangrovi TaxID=1779329 RepID=A0ABT2KFX4_9RHOB|nr:hypothetical protein [Alloyangia mangrovi]MCT4369260.1 hypothetical protein [Alloyangia mangrovi]